MSRIKVTKTKSAIKRPKNQKLTLEALGLRKIGQSNEFESSNSLTGMINKVKHLVSVQEIK
jgi:large subunit ribosomal protein L30